jgi:hypothetical protein
MKEENVRRMVRDQSGSLPRNAEGGIRSEITPIHLQLLIIDHNQT